MSKPILIGIDRGTGSGKTTVLEKIKSIAGENKISFLHHDSYYKDQSHKTFAERVKTNYDHPDSLETDLLISHLQDLISGKTVSVPIYDFNKHNRTKETEKIIPTPIIIIEGILVFVDKKLRDLFDIKIFVDTDADVRFIRRLKRDITERGRTVELVIEQYLTTVRPMHLEFVEPSKRYADVIIPEGGYNKVALEMVTSRIKETLGEVSS